MENKISEKTCIDFASALASRAPVPGGGGAAALVGALGVALCSMVANLTSGRKKYAQYEPDFERIIKEGENLREELLNLIDEDARMFEPLQKAYSIPKDNPERESIMQRVSVDACQAPLKMMRAICKSIDILEEMRIKGSITLISDVGCGALCAKSALNSAAMNIFVNTKSLPIELVKEIEAEADKMLEEYSKKAETVAELVMKDLRR